MTVPDDLKRQAGEAGGDEGVRPVVAPSWEDTLGSRADSVQEVCVPDDLLRRYVAVAMRRAVSKQLESGGWFAEIPGSRECGPKRPYWRTA